MPKIALTDGETVLKVWPVSEGKTEIAARYNLPNGEQVSPVVLDWTDGNHSVVLVSEFDAPEGKIKVGSPSYEIVNGEVIETYAVEDFRPMVRKSTVQQRLIDAGRMGDAYALLTSYPDKFARWFAPDRPYVYCDDADSVAFLMAMELDPAVFLSPEDM